MQAKAFCAGIRAIHTSLPYAKKLDDDSLMFLWMTVDNSVKSNVTDEMWVHACKMLIENWNPDSTTQSAHSLTSTFISLSPTRWCTSF